MYSLLRGITAAVFANFIFSFEASGEWIGRKCCDYAVSDDCRAGCLQVKSKESLALYCREEIEADLHSCIFRHQRKKRCCTKSENLTTHCQQACVSSFRSEAGPSKENMRSLEKHCPVEVQQCTKNYSASLRKASADTLLCCDKSNSEKCRNDCRRAMRSRITDREKIEELVEACGNPIPREPMWKCFISRSDSPRPTPPRVGPELQCCPKAISANCRQWCKKLYSKPWESSMNWKYFQQLCEFNPEESDLNICLQEVRAPCKMGCDSMSYCTNFNNRPTELFHSCNARADSVARAQMNEWSQGLIRLPLADIPILNIESCEPEKWKAVACALEIKPCSTNVGDSTICREDCVNLLRKCADHSRLTREMTVEKLCDMFSPSHRQHDCISLKKYTTASGRSSNIAAELTQPCNPNPCAENQLCVINRDDCRSGRECPAYKCLPGCKVGDVGDFLVHIGQRVRVPDWNRGEGCYRACACTSTGKLQHCTDLPCMDASKACTTAGQIKVHGSHFKIDCNFCTCYNGNVTCTKRQCKSKDKSDDNNRKFTGLPCNCEKHFVPVCAANGRTYPSTCLAKCMGHTDSKIQFGPCKARDPCASDPCKRNERCVRASRVCLTSSNEYDCPQYECVAPYRRCQERRRTRDAYASDGHHYISHRRLNSASRRTLTEPMFLGYDVDANTSDPVCDTNGNEYENICHLRKRHKTKLAYRGHCKAKCNASPKSPVCGQNIVTYENECSALAERVLVDYESGCHVVSVKGTEAYDCAGVTCRDLSNPECEPVVPPGACCPMCGGMLRVLYSQTHVDAVSKTAIKGPVSVRDVLRALRRHINVKECDVYGHLTIEGDIAILAVPVVEKPTSLQVEACLREAEGLGRFINERNPILASDAILSTLTAAEVHGSKKSGNGAGTISFTLPDFSGLFLKTWRLIDNGENSEDDFRDTDTAPFLKWVTGLALAHYMFAKYVCPTG